MEPDVAMTTGFFLPWRLVMSEEMCTFGAMKRTIAFLFALLLTLALSAQSQFRINGVQLDVVDSCETLYQDGMYSYEFRHAPWGSAAIVRLKMVTLPTTGKTLWRFLTSGFDGVVRLEVINPASDLPILFSDFEDECYVCHDFGAMTIADSRNGSDAFDDAEATLRQLASRYVFITPDERINMLGGALSIPADDSMVKKARSVLHDIFGLHTDSLNSECVIIPDFPETWETASLQTPYLSYSYRRSGDKAIFDVTQLTSPARQLVIRQPLGHGQYVETTATNQVHQVLVIPIPQRYPPIRFQESR